MGDRRGVFFPDPSFQDFLHLREREVAFVFAIIKMRREAYAGFGAVVNENFACEQFATNFVSVRAIHGNGSGALGGVFGGVDLPAARLRAFDEARGHAQRFFANGGDAHLIENVEAWGASKQRGYMRRAV